MKSHLDAFIEAHDEPSGYVQQSGVPVLRIGKRASLYLHEHPNPAAWLRSLAVAADDLAEQVDLAANPGLALADRHMAEAKAAAGIRTIADVLAPGEIGRAR